MKKTYHPTPTTIFFGLICGGSVIPLNLILSHMTSASNAICTILWLHSTAYAFLLYRWSRQVSLAFIFPAMFLFAAIFLLDSPRPFVILSLAVIGWIRSGICFQRPAACRLITASSLGIIGGILITAFQPHSAIGWSLGVWMFFLVQAIYFVFNEKDDAHQDNKIEPDPFEEAYRQAKSMLEFEKTVL